MTLTQKRKRMNKVEEKLRNKYKNKLDVKLEKSPDTITFDDDVIDKAKEIIDELVGSGLFAGRSIDGFIAGAIYLAGLLENKKQSQKIVGQAIGVSDATVSKRYQTITNYFEKEIKK